MKKLAKTRTILVMYKDTPIRPLGEVNVGKRKGLLFRCQELFSLLALQQWPSIHVDIHAENV